MPIIKLIDGIINLSTEKNRKNVANNLIPLIKTEISTLLDQINKNMFDFSNFSFNKDPNSNLTNKAGIYLIVNKKNKKFYLGGASNLAQRKGDYKRNFTNSGRINKVYEPMRADLLSGNIDDFVFIPILAFSTSNVLLDLTIDPEQTRNQKIMQFLDSQIEFPILTDFLQDNLHIKQQIYNTKAIGQFQLNNTYGGSANSGAPDKPVSINNYAWESISSAAKSLGCSTKTIRNKINNNLINIITPKQFVNFNGNKIFNTNAKDFFTDKKTELSNIKQIIKLN